MRRRCATTLVHNRRSEFGATSSSRNTGSMDGAGPYPVALPQCNQCDHQIHISSGFLGTMLNKREIL